jgi:hypothetical protein
MREVKPVIRDLWLVVVGKMTIRTTQKGDFIGFLPISKGHVVTIKIGDSRGQKPSDPWKKRRLRRDAAA